MNNQSNNSDLQSNLAFDSTQNTNDSFLTNKSNLIKNKLILFIENIRKKIRKSTSFLFWSFKQQGFWSRALICWIFSLAILKFDETSNYDTRFKLRGPQPVSNSIILINIKSSDMNHFFDYGTRNMINTNESTNLTDSYFWDHQLWNQTLVYILQQNPAAIGVTLFFGENILQKKLNSQEWITLKNTKIVWASPTQSSELKTWPLASLPDRSNVATIDIQKDEDGLIRRLIPNSDYIDHFSNKLTHLFINHQNSKSKEAKNLDQTQIINFRGLKKFQKINFKKVFDKDFPFGIFKDKIVLIGIENSQQSQIVTPIGSMTKHELWAHIIDNQIENRFITKIPFELGAFLLLILTIIAVLIITHFPQSVALFLFIAVSLIWSAFSIWIFDTFAIWTPLQSPLILILLIWITYLGYHAIRIEKAHSMLQQEQKYLSDLEQLKNNFVSLISHDLKTPIAKIQAVVDRLDHAAELPNAIKNDFINLKTYSDELNRYIQSILKVLRVESKDFKINKETADINGVIENVILRLNPLAQQKSIEIELFLDPIFLIEFDVTLITEVFHNLIENAIKYSNNNGLIQIKTMETDTEVIIEVKDYGEGIPQEEQLHIWKKFVRGKNQDLKTKGSGLGLYLVKYFIELHGGQVQLHSEIGKGTSFQVRLPIDLSS